MFDWCSSPLLTKFLSLLSHSVPLSADDAKLIKTLFILSSFTAINPTLFCQLPAEFNSNLLCMHIGCVCLYSP